MEQQQTEQQAGQGEQSQAQQTEQQQTQAPASWPENWRELVPQEYRETAARFTDPAMAFKSVADMRRQLSTAIQLPGKDAKPEDWNTIWNRLGRPETPERYEIERPDGLPEALSNEAYQAAEKEFLARMHAAGATNSQVQAAIGWYRETVQKAEAEAQAAWAATARQAEESLRRDWPGAEYDRNVEIAKGAVRQFGGEELVNFLNDSGLGNHPALVRAFAAIGAAVSGDAFHVAPNGEAAQSLQQEYDDLTRQLNEALDRGERDKANQLAERRSQLSRRLVGGGPLVGVGGRTL